MDVKKDEMLEHFNQSQETIRQSLERATAAASGEAVFGKPITHGEYMVITASEVTSGGGIGLGSGYGIGKESSASEATAPEAEKPGHSIGGGIGGGGGGGAMGRPVAVIVLGPEGVRVEPVVDRTKLGLAFFTALGAMLMALARMRRQSREL